MIDCACVWYFCGVWDTKQWMSRILYTFLFLITIFFIFWKDVYFSVHTRYFYLEAFFFLSYLYFFFLCCKCTIIWNGMYKQYTHNKNCLVEVSRHIWFFFHRRNEIHKRKFIINILCEVEKWIKIRKNNVHNF